MPDKDFINPNSDDLGQSGNQGNDLSKGSADLSLPDFEWTPPPPPPPPAKSDGGNKD